MMLFDSTKEQWSFVSSCYFNATIPLTGKLPTRVGINECTVTLPEFSRQRAEHKHQLKSLRAKFRVQKYPMVLDVPFDLTRIVQRRKEAVPYLKYSTNQPIVIRFVAEDQPYDSAHSLQRNDGVLYRRTFWDQSAFLPHFYIDENGLVYGQHREMAPNGTTKPPVILSIQLSSLSPLRDTINQQVHLALEFSESFVEAEILDEIRYFMRDERLYRFFLTQAISFIHIWLEYMAFRDEVRFYRKRKSFVGLSPSSVVTRWVCSLIIFLYLLDGGGTSWVVLSSVFGGVLVDAWKVKKVLRPSLSAEYPFLRFNTRQQTQQEQDTWEYDSIAMYYLGLILYPIVFVWSIYALLYEHYTSYYSWLISNLANAVYTFGFIGLCPQLYVNYRLKSVAHLPWKVFMYKLFTTFVDDVFAFLIEMPWKHRIMTLRDDVVFLLFLCQAYMYRVDKTRPNEYGYVYEEEENSKQIDGAGGEASTAAIVGDAKEKVE